MDSKVSALLMCAIKVSFEILITHISANESHDVRMATKTKAPPPLPTAATTTTHFWWNMTNECNATFWMNIIISIKKCMNEHVRWYFSEVSLNSSTSFHVEHFREIFLRALGLPEGLQQITQVELFFFSENAQIFMLIDHGS